MLQNQKRSGFGLQKLCFLTILCITSTVAAQTPYLKHFTVEDGLPSSTVYTAFQDSVGVMWFGTDNGITRFDGYRFETFNMSAVNASTDIWGITSDKKGRLWFSSQRQLTYLEKGNFKAIPFPKKGGFTTIQRHFVDEKNNHFVQFQNSTFLHEVNLEKKELIPFKDIVVQNSGHKLIFIKEDNQGIKWFFISMGNQVNLIGLKNGQVIHKVEQKLSLNAPIYISHLIPINSSIFLFPNNKNFIKIDLKKQAITIIESPINQEFEIINNHRTVNNLTLFNTNKGYKVVNKLFEVQNNLEFLNQFIVNDVFEDKQENVWICTRNEGVYFLPKKARESQVVGTTGNLLNDDITTLTIDKKGRVWFTNKNLELKILKTDGTVHTIAFKILNPIKPNTYFDDLKFDKQGNLYVGSTESLFLFVPKEAVEGLLQKTYIEFQQKLPIFQQNSDTLSLSKSIHFLRLSPIKSMSVFDNKVFFVTSGMTYSLEVKPNEIELIMLTNARAYASQYWKNKLWIGRKEQLFTLDIDKRQKEADPINLFPYPINALTVSNDNKLWIATDGNGLFRYDGEKIDTIKEFLDTRITIKELFVDKKNQLWIATNRGIGIVEVFAKKEFEYEYRMITRMYGLVADEVNMIQTFNSKIYAATSKGLTILNKSDIKKTSKKISLFFTNFLVNDEQQKLGKELVFSHRQRNIRIEYLCLSYSNMGGIEYEYQMEGIDKDWQRTNATFKEYPTLQPGTYIFRVRAKNLDGIITDIKTIRFTIKLPWWRTWTALVLFVLTLLGGSYLVFKYRLRQEKERNEKKRLEELTQLKTRFYANITHEFRTPLTLIMGLTRQLKKESEKSKIGVFEIIERHSHRLLNLINQLLDLNKLESKAMPLHYQNSDIIVFIKYVVSLFEPTAKDKQIQLTLYHEVDELNMDFDADKIQSILFNLLSNALKFTEANGQIIVHITSLKETEELLLKVKDTGVGINDAALAYVFNRYYQDKTRQQKENNTGIGLALVKELIEQMNGTIEVESSSIGTMFTIKLPILQEQTPSTADLMPNDMTTLVNAYFPTETITLINPKMSESIGKPLLLLVEDDTDLRQYLQTIVGQYYDIEVAKDGEEGIRIAIEKVPDLIVSDVMMPNKNGYELCETLKKDVRTSHIPIILLTAKTSKKDEIKGLKAGADVYMIKPFHQEELFLRINQLLENRRLLQQRYQTADLPEIKAVPDIQKEDKFVLRVREVIESNIDNYALDVTFLCDQLHVSRAQLHKKLTYLTGNSTTKFIKHVRLQKAEKLLKETDLNITEIAYETGFDVKYFSKVFNKKYGSSPSNYRKQLKN